MEVRFIASSYVTGSTVGGLQVQKENGLQYVALNYLPRALSVDLWVSIGVGMFDSVVISANGSDKPPVEGVYDYWEKLGFYATVEISGKWYLRLEAPPLEFYEARLNYFNIRRHLVPPTTGYEVPAAPLPEQTKSQWRPEGPFGELIDLVDQVRSEGMSNKETWETFDAAIAAVYQGKIIYQAKNSTPTEVDLDAVANIISRMLKMDTLSEYVRESVLDLMDKLGITEAQLPG